MKKRKLSGIICIVIAAAVLAIGGIFFALTAARAGTSRYNLSDERLFGITNLDVTVDTLREALKGRSAEIDISFTFAGDYMEDISPFVKELMDLAWEETGEPDEGDYLRYQMGGYNFSYGHEKIKDGYKYSISIIPVYYSAAEQERQADEKIAEVLKLLDLPANADEYEKIRAVYDYISANVRYDNVHKKNEYYTLKSTAYGALVNRSATCQGISVTIYRLLKELGVDCRVITGTGSRGAANEYHAWNIVGIDGLYYNLDATWDLNDTEEFFLKCDDNFPEHLRDDEYRTAAFYSTYPMAQADYALRI